MGVRNGVSVRNVNDFRNPTSLLRSRNLFVLTFQAHLFQYFCVSSNLETSEY